MWLLVVWICASPAAVVALSAAAAGMGIQSRGSATELAYFKEQETVLDVDEGAFKSATFWADVDASLPKGWKKDPGLERFRGFCENLRTRPPGEDVLLDNGEQLLSQYVGRRRPLSRVARGNHARRVGLPGPERRRRPPERVPCGRVSRAGDAQGRARVYRRARGRG